jgi:hypothetical protein
MVSSIGEAIFLEALKSSRDFGRLFSFEAQKKGKW